VLSTTWGETRFASLWGAPAHPEAAVKAFSGGHPHPLVGPVSPLDGLLAFGGFVGSLQRFDLSDIGWVPLTIKQTKRRLRP
jgi:hypothetical protein